MRGDLSDLVVTRTNATMLIDLVGRPVQMSSAGTQTDPTKGRSMVRPLPEVGTRHMIADYSSDTQYIKYISIPYIKELFEKTQSILADKGSSCTLMHKTHKNRLFGDIKDITTGAHTAMVTFSVACHTCACDIYSNAIDVTVEQRIKQITSCNNTSSNVTHPT